MSLFEKERDLNVSPDRVELRVSASALGQRVDDVNLRLDAFLGKHLTWRSRTSIQALVRDGYVLVDLVTPDHPEGLGELAVEKRPGRRLRHGTRVVVMIPPELRLPVPEATSDEIDVLYEDEHALAVDKPPGLPVHPSGRHFSDTLIQRVHARCRETHLERGLAPRLCHRLDRETSGIVLVAKDPAAHPFLAQQFEERVVEKEYLAIVRGVPDADAGTIDAPIGPARMSAVRLKMTVAVDGLPCRTDWSVVRRHGDVTLVRCRLHTGRQHQIRVHLQSIGLPIVGDKLYGEDEDYFRRHADGALTREDLERLELPRHALHHHRLVFTSSLTGAPVEVISPLPADLREYLAGRAWTDG
ncbi:MAG: RluA family pseudouridine synthase [Planctomycetes bacterium]|nr:RluA family pseudouridine synthase [Planctomycetota bacterium]